MHFKTSTRLLCCTTLNCIVMYRFVLYCTVIIEYYILFCIALVILMYLIIWLAPRAGKMNQIAPCDWLPERARWSHLARSGLSAVSRKQIVTKSHIINPLLTKFVRSRWLDIDLVLSLRAYGPRLRLGP